MLLNQTYECATFGLSSGLLLHRRVTSPVLSALWLVLFVFCTPPAFSQTVWFKYEGNPVMDVGPPGSWDSAGVCLFRVLYEDSVFRAWYSGGDGEHRRIGYATSPDGIQWAKHERPVLDLGPDGTWDWREATKCYVIHSGARYHMWYHGYDGSIHRIGHAQSENGITWIKSSSVNPVLRVGPSTWDRQSVGFPSVLKRADDEYRMWYTGYYSEAGRMQIGLAHSGDAKSWKKHSTPVLTLGDPGSWDDNSLLFPNVLFNGEQYEMWYGGSRATFSTSGTGYATSPDGFNWTKHPGNPVLTPGMRGSWDAEATYPGDVSFDGNFYRMWYGGLDGAIERTGFAISPKGMQIRISADGKYVVPGTDTVRMSVLVDEPAGLTFSAEIHCPGVPPIDHVSLLDDGMHGDSLAGDGLFANSWVPRDERHYSVDLMLKLEKQEPLTFRLDHAGAFTSIGPVTVDDVIFVNDPRPNPGDTIVIKLALRNQGASVQADSVSATISTSEVWITDLVAQMPEYGSIVAGGAATTAGYYRFFISPNCPLGTEIPFDVHMSSGGVARWKDKRVLSVLPPWWRSNWAYGLYAVIVLGLFYGAWTAETKRLRLKHRREMERFQIEKLKEVDHLKSRFFANISHEFRTPLTLIQGPIERMLSQETREDARDEYRMILRNSRRLLALVNELLDLSKIDSGEMKLHLREIDVVELVRGTAASFESLAATRRMAFSVNVPDGPIVGWFDRDALEKILGNLLSNAFKFTPEGGTVQVNIGTVPSCPISSSPPLPLSKPGDEKRGGTGKWVKLLVSDTGIGIPADQIDKVFDRFYQVDQSQARENEGTGIGLALTKELVELHHGMISVQSEVGKGTTFTISLPCRPEGDEHLTEAEITEAPRPVAQHVTHVTSEPTSPALQAVETDADESLPLVLIIEDNADMRKYMRTHLEGGYRLGEAGNGEEGVQKAIETIPDLIISDVMMPKMDGFEACRRIKRDERTSHIPIILLTAKAAAGDKVEGLETGADDYITKPFDARELLVRVNNLIEQRRKLREKFQRELVLHPGNVDMQSVDATFLKKTVAIIESHISDPMFDTASFAHEEAMSRMQLHRKLRALTNQGPGELIRSFRMKRAALLLQQKSGNISEIAYEVGYNNPSYFAQVFREHFGVAPSEYPLRPETHQQ